MCIIYADYAYNIHTHMHAVKPTKIESQGDLGVKIYLTDFCLSGCNCMVFFMKPNTDRGGFSACPVSVAVTNKRRSYA